MRLKFKNASNSPMLEQKKKRKSLVRISMVIFSTQKTQISGKTGRITFLQELCHFSIHAMTLSREEGKQTDIA